MSKDESNVRDVEKPEEVNFEKVVEPKQNSKILSFTTASMVNAASGTLMVQIANTFKEFEIEGFKSKFWPIEIGRKFPMIASKWQ